MNEQNKILREQAIAHYRKVVNLEIQKNNPEDFEYLIKILDEAEKDGWLKEFMA